MSEKAHHVSPVRTLRAIIASSFLTSLGVGMLSFAVPLVSLDARVSGAWLGTGFAGFFLARLLAGPLGGAWTDRVGARFPLLAGCTMGALAPVLYLIHPSIALLFAVQFLLGIVSGLVRPVGLAVIGTNATEDAVGRWFATHVLVFNISMFVGPLIGGWLYWNHAVEPLLVGMAVCMVLAHLVVFTGVPPTAKTRRLESVRTRPENRISLGILLVAVFGRTFGLGVFIAFYPVLLSLQLGVNGVALGALFAAPAFLTCIGLPFGAWLKKTHNMNTLVAGMALSALGLMIAGVSHEIWHFVGAGVVMGLGSALSIPESMRLTSAAGHEQGRVFGIAHMVTGGGFIVGPLFGGLVVQTIGHVEAAFVLAGLVGWFCLLAWDRYDGWKWPDSWGRWVLSRVFPAGCIIAAMVGATVFLYGDKNQQRPDLYKYTEMAMGTVARLTLEAQSQKAADDAARKAFAYMRTLQRDLDFRNPNGSVGRINASAGKIFVAPTRRAYGLICRATRLSALTDGVFDPTVGALTTSPLYYVLDETIAKSKKELVDYRLVEFDEAGSRVRLKKNGMALDLGGIAKGTIIDGTVRLLRKLGIGAGIVEAGGDFYCFGERDWTVGVRHPRNDGMYASVTVREKGVCGSGDYEQSVEVVEKGESTLLHHIIDPARMTPANRSIGVTVLAESAELADALSTTLFIMGAKEGAAFVKKRFPDSAAIWFSPGSVVSSTSNFPQ